MNIAKFTTFVIFVCLYVFTTGSCSESSAKKSGQSPESPYAEAITVGTLEDAEITESSGIASSKCQNDVYWTHNDSGDEAFLFAIGPKGEKRGTWRVPSATNYDWEDIASTRENGKCFIYIGDIGDNGTKRENYTIYKVEEPEVAVSAAKSSKRESLETTQPVAIRFTYPDGKHNAETLLVDPRTYTIYIVTKRYSGPARVFKLDRGSTVAAKLGEIALPAVPNGSVTGGDVSPNGDRVVLCDYSAVYEFALPKNGSIDGFITVAPTFQTAGKRNIGEAVTYSADGTALLLTSEGANSAIIRLSQRK